MARLIKSVSALTSGLLHSFALVIQPFPAIMVEAGATPGLPYGRDAAFSTGGPSRFDLPRPSLIIQSTAAGELPAAPANPAFKTVSKNDCPIEKPLDRLAELEAPLFRKATTYFHPAPMADMDPLPIDAPFAILCARISAAGRVSDAFFSSDGTIDKADTLSRVKELVFRPATRDGQAVSAWHRLWVDETYFEARRVTDSA